MGPRSKTLKGLSVSDIRSTSGGYVPTTLAASVRRAVKHLEILHLRNVGRGARFALRVPLSRPQRFRSQTFRCRGSWYCHQEMCFRTLVDRLIERTLRQLEREESTEGEAEPDLHPLREPERQTRSPHTRP